MQQSSGELSEWLKEHDWKSCNGLKPFGGSNPPLSAKSTEKPLKIKGFSYASFLYPYPTNLEKAG